MCIRDSLYFLTYAKNSAECDLEFNFNSSSDGLPRFSIIFTRPILLSFLIFASITSLSNDQNAIPMNNPPFAKDSKLLAINSFNTFNSSFTAILSAQNILETILNCLLYTSPSPRDRQKSRMPSSA
eukprot:TRINITY_DN1674_c0_g1_i1.p1 TRINITY_DN1674_c0_g1~~TRINITY_DN1674_c0_g1_i1.p1  ORF type:complete len:126 (-),score=14.40 TRINITY_DN1674_c0_g1_i1:29-406(-)